VSYVKTKNDPFFNDTFFLEVNPSIGRRRLKGDSSNQFKIRTITSYIWDINYRNSIYIKNDTGFLNSDTYLNNELFRIGGVNSIRGFNEQSIFTSNYTFFNIEYRFLTSQKSYLYSITDIGRIKENNKNLLGFGLGYLFNTSNSQININTVIEKRSSKPINLESIKLIVNWKNKF
jgi:hemolysin activation/secretion protein